MLKNQSGFSLIQVLVAMALMAALSLAMMKQQEDIQKMQTKMNYGQDINQVVNQIQTILADQNSCTATVAGATMNGPILNIKQMRLNPQTKLLESFDIFSVDKVMGSNSVLIQSMSLALHPDGAQDAIKVDFVAGRKDSGILTKKTLIGGNNITKYFRLNGDKDASGAYLNCYSEEGNLFKTLLKNLPTCTIVQGEVCTGIYSVTSEQYKMDVTLQDKYTRSGYYTKDLCGFGTTPGSRSCTCYGLNCSCDIEAYGCFTRHYDSGYVKEVIYKNFTKCCQPPTGGAPATTGGSSTTGGSTTGGGPVGGGCFVAGTQIALFNGESKNIEDVEQGDVLIDGQKNKVVVKNLLRFPFKGQIYSINGSGYFFTPNHPLKSLDGWKSLTPAFSEKESGVKVSMLKVGDILVKSSGLEVVYGLDSIYREETVYNFNVSDTSEYIADDFVVHNKEVPVDPTTVGN